MILDFLHHPVEPELAEIYLHRFLRVFAFGLINVFVPVYLLKIGFSFQQVLSYLLIQYLTFMAFTPTSVVFEQKKGIRNAITWSTFILLAAFFTLFTINNYHWPIQFIAFLFGIQWALYWTPININFARNAGKRTGVRVGAYFSIPRISLIIAPVLGAYLISFYGFNLALAFAFFTLVLSLVPLFFSKDFKIVKRVSFKIFFKRQERYFLMFFIQGLIDSGVILWPLFVYFAFSTYSSIGWTVSARFLISTLFPLFIGFLTDKISKKSLLAVAGLFNALVWLLVIKATTFLEFIVLSLALGASLMLINVPFFALASKKALKEGLVETIALREMLLNAGRIFGIIIAILTLNLYHVFILIIISSLVFSFYWLKS